MATISEALAIAVQHQQGGRLPAAEQIYRQILAVEPNQPDALHLLGVIAIQHHEAGRLQAAEQIYRQILALQPNQADAWHLLGVIAYQVGKHGIAVEYIGRAITLSPYVESYYLDYGNTLKEQGKFDEAVACYRRALELKPDYAEAHNNLGVTLNDQRKWDEAIACYRRALELKPDYAEAHNNLGIAIQNLGKLDEAVACCRCALELKPDYADAHNNLGNALKDQGKLDEAVACYRRALELKPDFVSARSNLLCTLQYCTGVTPSGLAEAHAEYDRRHAAPLYVTLAQHENARDRHRRLRLGFISPDLARHPVGVFLVRVLENLSQEQYETICYSDRMVKDDLTLRLQAATTRWRDVIGISDQRLAEQIRADRIDILFDLAGHTADNRLLVFARKPAPIQIAWIGYEGTTGLAAMDHLLADRHVLPQGTEHYYRERVLRMPEGYLCYDPPEAAPPIGPPPSLAKAYASFGSFNNPAKIGPEVVAVWAEILRRAATARLVLKYRGLGDPTVKRQYFDLFAAHHVEPQRLELLPSSSYAEYLAAYLQVDVTLDPFPFSGSATTCDALWMGVLVVSCPGETFASRHSLSHLSSVGLTETIARDLKEYVELAVSLAGDLPRLAALRAGLRQRMAASPLCDGKRFATNFMSMLQDVWEQWIGSG